MMPLVSRGMYDGWGPRRRTTARTSTRNVRSARSQRALEARCSELTSELAESRALIQRIESENDENRKKIDKYESQFRHLQSEILRAHGDVQRNKQLAAEKENQAADRAKVEVASRIMTVADDFANALEVAQEQGMDPKWFDGFKAMAEKVDNCLVSVGYRRFESLGEEMDPSRHEALATMPTSNDQVGRVIQVIEAGYEDTETLKVIRVAKVLVGRPFDDA